MPPDKLATILAIAVFFAAVGASSVRRRYVVAALIAWIAFVAWTLRWDVLLSADWHYEMRSIVPATIASLGMILSFGIGKAIRELLIEHGAAVMDWLRRSVAHAQAHRAEIGRESAIIGIAIITASAVAFVLWSWLAR